MRPHPVIFFLGQQSFLFGYFALPLVVVGLLLVHFFPLHKRNIIVDSSGYEWQIITLYHIYYS